MDYESKWLTVEQIAKHLQVSKETIYRWLDRGSIPAHKIGRQWRFQIPEIDGWVREGNAGSAQDSHAYRNHNNEVEGSDLI